MISTEIKISTTKTVSSTYVKQHSLIGHITRKAITEKFVSNDTKDDPEYRKKSSKAVQIRPL